MTFCNPELDKACGTVPVIIVSQVSKEFRLRVPFGVDSGAETRRFRGLRL